MSVSTGERKPKMEQTLVKSEHLAKDFSGIYVLQDINVEIEKGEIFGIIGENGAGKSTFIKLLNGTYGPSRGTIQFDGETVHLSPSVSKHLGITTIPQEFNLVSDLTVYENIFLGQEYQRQLGFLDRKRMRLRTRELMQRLHADVSPEAEVSSLSVAEKQMVEIAKAVAFNSRLLIMDEPTTVLTPIEIRILFDLMRRLKEQGVTIIYISHKLKEVQRICDRVMVLRDGTFISLDPVENLDEHEMANRMVGREMTQIFPEKAVAKEEVVLEVEGLSVPNLLHDISFSLRKGEILGFAGLGGSGRTELSETIVGLRKKSSGIIRVRGSECEIKSPSDAIAQRIAYLPEDRQGAGILTGFDVTSNITLSSLRNYTKLLISRRKEQSKAQEYVKSFDIKAASLRTRLEFLSGGNQQKVSLAKSLDTNPSIFIFDEPTRGIDVSAKMQIFQFIRDLVDEGISCVFISSELEEIIGVCSRVLVMREGRIAGMLEDDRITEEEIMKLATGVSEGGWS